MAGASGAETSAAQLQAAARSGSDLTKGERCNKLYSYFSFGADARERSQRSAHKATNCASPKGEASGPPADAEI